VSSPIAALTISRMPVDRFLFAGFIPKTEIAKINFFQELLHITATLIFFESPNRLLHSLRILADISPTRLCCVVRELTKMHQEVKFAPVSELLKFYQHQDLLGKKIKGEVILLVAGAARSEVLGNNEESIEHQLNKYLVQELRVGQGVRLISHRAYQKFNSIYSKKQIYKIAVSLQEQLKTQDN
jgi:16S rRNA (cytidine1402-2'-O)-methyltransferase